MEHPIPVATTDTLPGRAIASVVGDVVGVVIRDRDPGGNREIQARTLLNVRQEAVARMCSMAQGAGAHAVVGLRFDSGEINDHFTEILAYGTAVRLGESTTRSSATPPELPRPSTTS